MDRLRDAARFVDPDDINRGLLFDGRVAEDLKLSGGTWVSVGTLRPDVVAACSPLVYDVVIAGHDRSDIGDAALACAISGAEYASIGGLPALQRAIGERLETFNLANPGSSRAIGRFRVLIEPPLLDAGEITDKGYINQRTVLERRNKVVDEMYYGA